VQHGDLRSKPALPVGLPTGGPGGLSRAAVPAARQPGPVDPPPLGVATVHVREGAESDSASANIVITEAEIEAARKGRTVVRQGTFTGAQEVKA
jgi:hypothetical protein